MYSKDMNLSLDGDTFSILKGQFDSVLARTIGNMQMKGADDATITLKLSIGLEKENRSTANGNIEATIPKFKHDISSVLQVKDKVSGELVGDYQLIWDEYEKKYVMRKIDNGQTTMLDDEPNGKFVDADYQFVDELPGDQQGPLGLPEPAENGEESLEPDDTADLDGSEPDAAEENAEEPEGTYADESSEKPDRYDERTPFGWLAQFVGEEMRVTEAMGNYTVRTTANKVVLSSATDPSNPFYCDRDKLSEHVGHKLICAGYGKEELTVISIQCSGCAAALFTLVAPGATEEEISEAMADEEDISDDDLSDDYGYEYDPPEE